MESLLELGEGIPWRLLLIGGAATAPQDVAFAAALQARINHLGIAPRVIRTGHVNAADVSANLLAADCAALPFLDGASFRRGSLLAALVHGCPLITTTPDDPVTAVALADGRVTVLTPPGDTTALTVALARLAASSTLRADLAAAGRRATAPFAWPEIARRHAQFYTTFAVR